MMIVENSFYTILEAHYDLQLACLHVLFRNLRNLRFLARLVCHKQLKLVRKMLQLRMLKVSFITMSLKFLKLLLIFFVTLNVC